DVEAVDLGELRSDGKLVVKWGDAVAGELDQAFLHDGLPRTPRKAEWVERAPEPARPGRAIEHGEALEQLLAHPSICSREWIVRQYDHEVQGQSALKSLVGARSRGP